MLDIINNLSIFFEDCYREFSVREYSRKMNISPPTASKMLKSFAKEGLLVLRKERGFLLFKINRGSEVVRDLSLIYWKEKLTPLTDYLDEMLFPESIVLFGSLSKLEVRKESDIDIAVFSKSKKKIDLSKFEKKLEREIQIFVFESLDKAGDELGKNIINSYKLGGFIS